MASNPRGQQVIQLSIAVGVIDTIAIALRVLARCNDGARLAFDDWLIVASLVPFYAMIVTSSLRRLLIPLAIERCLSLFADVQDHSCYQRRTGETYRVTDGQGSQDLAQSRYYPFSTWHLADIPRYSCPRWSLTP